MTLRPEQFCLRGHRDREPGSCSEQVVGISTATRHRKHKMRGKQAGEVLFKNVG
jgi:hypothetical protein